MRARHSRRKEDPWIHGSETRRRSAERVSHLKTGNRGSPAERERSSLPEHRNRKGAEPRRPTTCRTVPARTDYPLMKRTGSLTSARVVIRDAPGSARRWKNHTSPLVLPPSRAEFMQIAHSLGRAKFISFNVEIRVVKCRSVNLLIEEYRIFHGFLFIRTILISFLLFTSASSEKYIRYKFSGNIRFSGCKGNIIISEVLQQFDLYSDTL